VQQLPSGVLTLCRVGQTATRKRATRGHFGYGSLDRSSL
jgi:hypothetical protein